MSHMHDATWNEFNKVLNIAGCEIQRWFEDWRVYRDGDVAGTVATIEEAITLAITLNASLTDCPA